MEPIQITLCHTSNGTILNISTSYEQWNHSKYNRMSFYLAFPSATNVSSFSSTDGCM